MLSAALLFAPASASAALQNVNGGDLQKCSGDGMALTGFTRNGKCMDQYAAARPLIYLCNGCVRLACPIHIESSAHAYPPHTVAATTTPARTMSAST